MIAVIYLLVFGIMVPISVYLLAKHRRSNLVFWGAVTLLCAGLGGLQVALERIAIPYFADNGMPLIRVETLIWISDKLNNTIHSVPYWSILIFFLNYAGFSNKILNLILSMPVWISIWNDKIEGITEPVMNYPFILSWGVPYAGCSVLLLLYVLFKERNWPKAPRHLGTAAIYLLPETALILYQSDGWYTHLDANLLIYISILLLFSSLLVVTLYLNHTFLGVNRENMSGKIQIGTRMMQHAFKNSAGKVKLNALNLRNSLKRGNYEDAERQLDYLLSANDHLLGMMDKLSYTMRNKITLKPETHDLLKIAEEVAAPFSLQTNMIFLIPSTSVSVQIDKELVIECLTNIIDNALEAMDGSGKIEIGFLCRKTKVALSVTDSGKGMDRIQLASIAEPFYSTKTKSGRNFGLGMYYVKKVMDAHKGKLQVSSQLGKGTCVTLEFPVRQKRQIDS